MEKIAPEKKHFETLIQLMSAFPDEQAAINHFTAIRWKNGAFCAHCGSAKIYHFSDKRTHKCGDCRKRFSIKVGTIFEDSKIELRKWMMAIWLISLHKKGIASTQLAKDICVTQKTAWFMLHRLRHAAQTKSFNRPLEGDVEADETFIGDKGKTAVLGILQSSEELVTGTVRNLRGRAIQGAIASDVAPGVNIMTDEDVGFMSLEGCFHYHTVNHSAGQYLEDFYNITNGTENVWAQFKRQIIGIYHYLLPKHLSRYPGEMTWRFNLPTLGEGDRVNALLDQIFGRLTYKALIV